MYPSTSTFHDRTQGSTNSEFIARVALYHKAMYTCMHICYHTCTACKNVFHNPGHVLIRNKKNAGKHISKISATITIHRFTEMLLEIGSVTCIKNNLFNGHEDICKAHILSYPKTNLLPCVIAEHAPICNLLEHTTVISLNKNLVFTLG